MLHRALFFALFVVTGAFADTITLIDGTSFEGQVIKITDQTVFLRIGRQTSEFYRVSVETVTFSNSDLVVLATRDTLRGKVLRMDDTSFTIALEHGLRVVQSASVIEINSSVGPPLRLRDLGSTDDAFHVEEPTVEVRRSAVFLSVYAGTQTLTYSDMEGAWWNRQTFDKSVSAVPYGLELGIEFSSRMSVALGASRFFGKADVSHGTPYTERVEVGYSCLSLSGMYNFFPENSLDVFGKVQVILQTGESTVLTHSVELAATSGQPELAIVPGAGVKYALGSLLFVYAELDWHSSTTKLNRYGDSINMEGPAFFAGLRLHLPKLE